MRHPALILFLTLFTTDMSAGEAPPGLDVANVIFDSPSTDASGAVPLGNGEMGAGAWIETNGDLLLYLSRPDSVDKEGNLLKIGKVRISLDPAPSTATFRQELKLRQGRLEADFGGTHLELFTDPDRPILRVTARSLKPTVMRVAYEPWRKKEPLLSKDQAPDALVWYHRNEDSIVAAKLKEQSLDQLPGTFDPYINRTFGAWVDGPGFKRSDDNRLVGGAPATTWDLRITCPLVVADKAEVWVNKAKEVAQSAPEASSVRAQNETWWDAFWNRSWIVVKGEESKPTPFPASVQPLRIGSDSKGNSQFNGTFGRVGVYNRALTAAELQTLATTPPEAAATVTKDLIVARMAPKPGDTLADDAGLDLSRGATFEAWIKADETAKRVTGHIFNKGTAHGIDGFMLFNMARHDRLQLNVRNLGVSYPHVFKAGVWQHVAYTYDTAGAVQVLLVNGKELYGKGTCVPATDPVTCGYNRQRYVTACQGRGEFPIKFNGGMFTVEPKFALPLDEPNSNADWRQWGGAYWFQNTRHLYHPLLASGDHSLMAPFFAFYSRARPLNEARIKSWYEADGCAFPETITHFGAFLSGDYGVGPWRAGRKVGDVYNGFVAYYWSQGPELVGLMLDYWDWTGDERFLNEQLLPMSVSILRYFDTRFKKDAHGVLIISPTQSLETYQGDVINDLPCVAAIRSITTRLMALPSKFTNTEQRAFFARMNKACPPIPTEERMVQGKKTRVLAPAEKFVRGYNNCENPELYAIWPFHLYGLGKPDLELARATYEVRSFHLDLGWGYDGNIAACLGLADEAARILMRKCADSHPAYRFPATWSPNWDWVPDQNHGGNLMETAQLMLMQCEGDKIALLPAWPKEWDVNFKLHAPMQTTVECEFRKGKIIKLVVQPESRRKNITMPDWLK
jgi:hypothetical protein